MRSFYYLARLLAKNPGFYYTHSAHNFARGVDLKQALVGGVELSTDTFDSADKAVDDLLLRRADLASVCSGLIVPLGHLIDCDTPTNTCAIHVHIGGIVDKRRVYGNIVHFLPVLSLFTINSPYVSGSYFGQSYRMHKSWAIGQIRDDWTYRFQDIILSKRLGTIELRVCDPCWDIERIRWLVRAVEAIAGLEVELDPNTENYNHLRPRICQHGLISEIEPLVGELRELVDFPLELLERSASDEVKEALENHGMVGVYSALDNGYRTGRFAPRAVDRRQKVGLAEGVLGFVGYFVPRLPYYAWKGIKES